LSIEKGLASLEQFPEGEEEGEEEAYEEDPQVSQPIARPVPRRASLAVDTMGGPMYQQDSMKKE